MKEENKQKPKKVTAKNAVEQILNEEDNSNVVLYDDNNNPIEFEQVALIPLESTDKLYAILIPVTPMQGVNEGEGVCFEIDEDKMDVNIVNDEDIIDEVLTVYQSLIGEGEGEDEREK